MKFSAPWITAVASLWGVADRLVKRIRPPYDQHMAGNPKSSEWYSTPREKRHRKKAEFSLAPETVERLEKLAERRGTSKSAVVEELIMAAPLK